MKRKILTIVLVSAILISTMNIFVSEIPIAEAQSGPPYLLVKNPYLNDTNYWSAECAWGLEPGSYSIINSTGWWSYAKKQNPLYKWEFAKWYNPYGCTYALQGMYPANKTEAAMGINPIVKGQGMNYYVYIPANIGDGQIICNVTTRRLKNPQAYGTDVLQGGGFFGGLLFVAENMPLAALFHRTNIGIYFFLALKVRFWDDSYVPAHLRGKETYLGWMTPRNPDEFYGNGPHAGHIEFWTDTRVAPCTNPNDWQPASWESGFPSWTQPFGAGLIDYPAFVGSTQDWDFHNSRTLNVTALNVYETITVDIGKQFRELVQWWDSAKYHIWDPMVGRFLGFFGLAGRSFPSMERLCYDIVGATLIGVGPTMELIQSDMACQFNWVQIYDYRSGPVTDQLFWDCIEHWKWMQKNGWKDPWQEYWTNAILPSQTLKLRQGQLGKDVTTTASPKSVTGKTSILDTARVESAQNRFNLTAIANLWAKAGVEYNFVIKPTEWNLTKGLKATVTFYSDYTGVYGGAGNNGIYLDYEFKKGTTTLSKGTIVIRDHIQQGGAWSPGLLVYTFNLTFPDSTSQYTLKLTPNIQAWTSSAIWIHGVIQVHFSQQFEDPVKYTLNVNVNNSSWGSVSPRTGTYTCAALTNITLTANVFSGKYFWFWIIRNDRLRIKIYGSQATLILNVTRDYNITAYFGQVNYSLKKNFPLTIAGDVNFDGKVDITDLNLVSTRMGKNSGQSDWVTSLSCAIDILLYEDGLIDIRDLQIVSANYGKVAS